MKGLPTPIKAFLLFILTSLALVAPSTVPTVPLAIIKCLPIACLACFLLEREEVKGEAAWVLLALMFSMVGDFYVLYSETHFIHGVLAFVVAQLAYIGGLGFRHTSWSTGAMVHGAGLVSLCFVLPLLQDPLHKVAVTFYSFIIITVFWCAVDRARLMTEVPYTRRLCSLTGAATFLVSDLCFVLLQVGAMVSHVPAQLIILSTYYTAQLFHTLGSAKCYWSEPKKKKTM